MKLALLYTIPIIALHAALRSSGYPGLQLGLQLAWGALCIALYLRAESKKEERSAWAIRRIQVGFSALILAAFYAAEYYGFPTPKLDEVPMGLTVGANVLMGLLAMLLGFRIEKRFRAARKEMTK